MVWFDPEMSWFVALKRRPGHPERFSAAAIPFCLSITVLFGLPLRQTTGFVESLLSLSGLTGRCRITQRFRRLVIRYERRADIHEAFVILGCALICLDQIRRFC